MNTFATVVVTSANKAAAQKVISALYSTPATDTEDAVVSIHGTNFFDTKLKKNLKTYWASSGAFLTDELTALTNSGLTYIVYLGYNWKKALADNNLTKIIIKE
tara:strand:- start:1590 stop:1898 length:309 start_codon:yes stop_codon:yes gene_type:complete